MHFHHFEILGETSPKCPRHRKRVEAPDRLLTKKQFKIKPPKEFKPRKQKEFKPRKQK